VVAFDDVLEPGQGVGPELHEDLADVVTRHISGFAGIRQTRTSIAFRAYSRHDIEAVFSIGSE